MGEQTSRWQLEALEGRRLMSAETVGNLGRGHAQVVLQSETVGSEPPALVLTVVVPAAAAVPVPVPIIEIEAVSGSNGLLTAALREPRT